MDDETAEIELLEQNLNKTHHISQRMISILDGYDTRLAKLEKSILPLYTSSQLLNRRASNIEKTLIKIDEVTSSREDIEAEEALILRGPQPDKLSLYTDALERLNTSIAFKGSDAETSDSASARLVETGTKKLCQLYTTIVAEGSVGPAPVVGAELESVSLKSKFYDQLVPVVAFLRTLPLPATHPSHPAAAYILTTFKEAQKGFADMRGNWCVKCLEISGKRVLDRAETIDPVLAGDEFGKWVGGLLSASESEYNLLLDLSLMANPPALASSYTALLNPILTLFSKTLTSLIAFIKRSLHKYTFLALSSYEHMLLMQERWDDVLSLRGSNKESNEFREGITTLRSLCMRSFPEFLVDLKVAAIPKPNADLNTGLADFVLSTVRYMERIPEVQVAAANALLTLGDGNWKMGEGVPLANKQKLREGDEAIIMEHYTFDVITTAINTINTLSQTSKRGPPFGSIFLINNISHLRKNILFEPKNENLLSLLSRPTQDAINSNFRTAKAAYMDANFSPLMQALSDDPKEKAGKSNIKEKFTRFYDLLEEVVERHKFAQVLEDDPSGREAMCDDIVKLVVPSLQRFVQKYRDKDLKNPSKYIKLSPEAVETQLKSIYR